MMRDEDQQRRPLTEADLAAMDIDLAHDFPDQALADLHEYPVLSEGVRFIVIKNQRTLQEIARWPWRLLGVCRVVVAQRGAGVTC